MFNVLLLSIRRIRLTTEFPPSLSGPLLENVQVAAIDLCSSIMEYASLGIMILRKSVLSLVYFLCLLMAGNVLSSIFRGSQAFDDATRKVNLCIHTYTAAVLDLGCEINISLISSTVDIQAHVDELSERFGKFFTTFEAHARLVETSLQRELVPPQHLVQNTFLVPFERNPMFCGRDSLLQQIEHELLLDMSMRYNHRLALHGLGGVGKTQVALEYAYQHKNSYDHVFWIQGAERTLTISDLTRVARETNCIDVKDESQPEMISSQVLKWLNHQCGWLLIIDNVNDVNSVKDLLPATGSHGHVLITTRDSDVKRIPAEGLEIPPLPLVDAVELLFHTSDNSDQSDSAVSKASQIVSELGMLPLAIDQAAAFIRMSSLDTFIQIFRSNKADFLKEPPAGNHSYVKSVYATWSMALDRLSPNAIQLAEAIAFLNPDTILLEFLEAGGSALRPELHDLIEDKFAFVKAISELKSYSFVKLRDHGKEFSMHRLVQCVIRERCTHQSRLDRQKEIIRMFSIGFHYSHHHMDLASRLRFRRFLPQIMGALAVCDEALWALFAADSISDSVPAFLYDEGQIGDCVHLNRRVVEARERMFGSEDTRTLLAKRFLASAYHQWRPDSFYECLNLYENVLRIQTRLLGDTHIRKPGIRIIGLIEME
jgi:NB-ARC domain